MKARFDYFKSAPGAFKAMLGLGQYLHESGLEESLVNLIDFRASQINGCAYCLDMHSKDLRAAVTLITDGHVPDEVYERVRQQFNEKELANLTLAVVTINGWNRLNIAARTVPGDYKPGQFRPQKIAS